MCLIIELAHSSQNLHNYLRRMRGQALSRSGFSIYRYHARLRRFRNFFFSAAECFVLIILHVMRHLWQQAQFTRVFRFRISEMPLSLRHSVPAEKVNSKTSFRFLLLPALSFFVFAHRLYRITFSWHLSKDMSLMRYSVAETLSWAKASIT